MSADVSVAGNVVEQAQISAPAAAPQVPQRQSVDVPRQTSEQVTVADRITEHSIEEREETAKKAEVATGQLNDVMTAFDKGIRFRLFKKTDQMYVQVVDRSTEEVIRTIPSEEMLEHMARMHEVLGMILDAEG